MCKYKGYNKEELDVCLLVWGCVPVDFEWAKNTVVFKDFLDNSI